MTRCVPYEAREPAQQYLLRREHGHQADCPGYVEQVPVGQRQQAGCTDQVAGRQVDREIVGGDCAPAGEAVGRVICWMLLSKAR
ncbi:MAG: hypothetical protein ACJ797_16170 [Ktedonobacteraceae bacterium]